MPKLNEVVASILASLDNAQHQSNKVSRNLADNYKNDDVMKFFSLPNATISEADITLRYAIKGDDAVKASPLSRQNLDSSATESLYAARVRAARIVDVLMQDPKLVKLFEGTKINNKYAVEIFVNNSAKIIYNGKKAGRSDLEIAHNIVDCIKPAFDSEEVFQKRFSSIFENELYSEKFMENVKKYINKKLRNNPDIGEPSDENVNGNAELIPQDIEVIVDNNILQNLPENMIQTIQFKARIRNYRWIVDKNSSNGEFVLAN